MRNLSVFAPGWLSNQGIWLRPSYSQQSKAGESLCRAALLEALQSLQPNHPPNLLAALSGAGGASAAALLASFMI